MNPQDLSELINEYAQYCIAEYQPSKLNHMSLNEALKFQNEMCQSLTNFGLWLRTKSKETT